MQIPTATQNTLAFSPPAAATLIQQDNQQSPMIMAPTSSEGAPSQGFSQSQQQASPGLYTRQGVLPNETKVAEESESKESQTDKEAVKSSDAPSKNMAGKELSPEQQQELLQMQQRDQEVRLHEQQHASVGGQHTGSPSYEFKTGPDGKQYVVEGSVAVDVTPVAGDPSATIEKMRQVKAAALAPAQPSSADKNAAALADSNIAMARAELMQSNKAPTETNNEDGTASTGTPTESAASTAANKPDSVKAAPKAAQTQPVEVAELTGASKVDKAQVELRNQVIAGVYGQSAQAQSQQLLNLA